MATRLTIRLDFELGRRLGAGKVALLESIDKTGSISAAGRAHQMSYRRAWLLVDELNQLFTEPVVSAHHGGAKGGGAALTDQGRRIVALYRDAEAKMRAAAQGEIDELERNLGAGKVKRLRPLRPRPRRREAASKDTPVRRSPRWLDHHSRRRRGLFEA